MKTTMELFLAKTKPGPGGCIDWTGCTQPNGYGKLNYKYRTWLAHRWIYVQTHDVELSPEQLILHSCDRRCCVNVQHLRVGDHKDNAADMDARGRRNPGGAKGIDNHTAKLTEDEVRSIRALRQEGLTLVSLGERFGVSFNNIASICDRKTWRHVA